MFSVLSHLLFLPSLHNPRRLPSVALTWFSRHTGTFSGVFPLSPQHRALPPAIILCKERISGSLLSFNTFRPVVLRVEWKVKPAIMKWAITHTPPPLHFLVSFCLLCHSLLFLPWMYLFLSLSSSPVLFHSPPLPVPQSFSLYLYLYQHIKTNYNSRWTTAASHQFP